MTARDASYVAPNIAIVSWSRPAAGARDEDDARQKITLSFKELAPCWAWFEFLEFWNGSRMKPEFWNEPVNDGLVMPRISMAEAQDDESLAAKIGQVRRDWERNKAKYATIADAVCRGARSEAGRLHTALLSGAIETAFVAVRYIHLCAEGEKAVNTQIAREYGMDLATVHRHLEAARKTGRWPALVYPRRAGMRKRMPEEGETR